MSEFHHISVLLQECLDGLNIKPNGIYVDGTLGGAGHSRCIAERLTTGKLIGIDRDTVALQAASERLHNKSCFLPSNISAGIYLPHDIIKALLYACKELFKFFVDSTLSRCNVGRKICGGALLRQHLEDVKIIVFVLNKRVIGLRHLITNTVPYDVKHSPVLRHIGNLLTKHLFVERNIYVGAVIRQKLNSFGSHRRVGKI